MGAIRYRRIEFVATISELTGYKAGLALSRDEIVEHVPEFDEWFDGNDDDQIRIRAEEVEELFGNLLFAVGAAAAPGITIPHIELFHRYKGNPKTLALWTSLMDLFKEWGDQQEGGPFDLSGFVEAARHGLGPDGERMALELAIEIEQSIHKRLWHDYRRIEWEDVKNLSDLFESEQLGGGYGRFFDQRFGPCQRP